MKIYLSMIIVFCFLGSAAGGEQGIWNPAEEIGREKIGAAIASIREYEPQALRQPTILAYRTAVFLATGSVDTPTVGAVQSVNSRFSGGEEIFDRAVTTVEFMGYADDSLYGERFVISLHSGEDGIWQVTGIERSAYGRGDHR